MKNRKIVIPLFIILIISFVAMIFFYFYKKHNDKIKKKVEKKRPAVKPLIHTISLHSAYTQDYRHLSGFLEK